MDWIFVALGFLLLAYTPQMAAALERWIAKRRSRKAMARVLWADEVGR